MARRRDGTSVANYRVWRTPHFGRWQPAKSALDRETGLMRQRSPADISDVWSNAPARSRVVVTEVAPGGVFPCTKRSAQPPARRSQHAPASQAKENTMKHPLRIAVGGLTAALLAVSPGLVEALGATANGPYYAEPSWDQMLPASTRFIVLSNFNSEAVLDRETGLVWQ